MGYRVDVDVLPEEDDGSSFFLRHWRGNLSLAKSWFLVGGALSTLAVYALTLGLLALEQSAPSLQFVAIGWILFFVLFALLRTWALVGIWRSAGKHEARGGKVAWAHVARGLLVLGLMATLGQGHGFALQAMEYGKLAMGQDSLGQPADIAQSADGKEIAIRGSLVAGTAQRFEEALDRLSAAEAVVLTSNGGRLFEAERIADAIRQRGLDTRVERLCESACTFILLAGRERHASRLARIGFHQPDFPGYSNDERQAAIAQQRLDYRRAGVTDVAFIDQAMSAAPDAMWYPSHDELVEAGVLTGEEVRVGGSRSDALAMVRQELQAGAAQVNARGPTRLDEVTTLIGARAEAETLTYIHRIDADRSQVDIALLRREMAPDLRRRVCGSDLAALVALGATFRYAYQDAKGRQLIDIPVENCRPT
jgi:hypothetical protein